MERVVPPATSVTDVAVLASAVLLGLLIAVVTWMRKVAWPVAFGGAWFLLALLPVSNAVPLDAFMAEHWLYLPSMGLFMAVGWLAARGLRGRFRGPVAAALALVVGAYAVRTVVRNAEWRDAPTLFEATLRDSPSSFRALSGLGNAHLEAGDTRRAAELHARALAHAGTPRRAATAHANLGVTYWSEGRYELAVEELRQAIEVGGRDAAVYTSLAAAYAGLDRLQDAEDALERAIATDPRYATAHVNLGAVREQRGQLARARESYERALQLDPDSVEAYTGLGDVHLAEGRPDLAERAYSSALSLRPELAPLRERLDRARKARAGAPP